MKKFLLLLPALWLLTFCSVQPAGETTSDTTQDIVTLSPGNEMKVVFNLTNDGRPYYRLYGGPDLLLDTSMLGFRLADGPDLTQGLTILDMTEDTHDETWNTTWGEEAKIRDHYQQKTITLGQKNGDAKFTITFRAFDNGVGFRYGFPEDAGFSEFTITDELTQFNIMGDPTAWWMPANYDTYEFLYNKSKLSQIAKLTKQQKEWFTPAYGPKGSVATPLTIKKGDSAYMAIHEAALVDYAGMTLGQSLDKPGLLEAALVPYKNDPTTKVKAKTPFNTPWRVVLYGRKATDLIGNYTVLNLNEPNKIEGTDWIKPLKYIGIWWGMHMDKYTWHAGEKHGATTENTLNYIRFAAENEIGGVLAEGWNTGWENWRNDATRYSAFDFITPYPDFDLESLANMAKTKGVQLIGHHETAGGIAQYEKQMEDALRYYSKLGINYVKTGYVGTLDNNQWHHGQVMVNHYQKVIETAAKYKINIDAHEPIKATGLRRTWPNFMTREGVRGQEYNGWSDGNPPSHLAILPFTRALAGPTDYTPGIFDIKFDKYKGKEDVKTTLAHQLALYVVLYSPLQMAADLIENYEGHPAFKFIEDVPVDWQKTIALQGEVGEFLVIARQDRNSKDWFIGGITNEQSRTVKIPLSFLAQNHLYDGQLYTDEDESHYLTKPTEYQIKLMDEVVATDTLTMQMAPGGGFAVRLKFDK